MNSISILFIPNKFHKFLASNIFTTASLFLMNLRFPLTLSGLWSDNNHKLRKMFKRLPQINEYASTASEDNWRCLKPFKDITRGPLPNKTANEEVE